MRPGSNNHSCLFYSEAETCGCPVVHNTTIGLILFCAVLISLCGGLFLLRCANFVVLWIVFVVLRIVSIVL